jgi:hypothetical protein
MQGKTLIKLLVFVRRSSQVTWLTNLKLAQTRGFSFSRGSSFLESAEILEAPGTLSNPHFVLLVQVKIAEALNQSAVTR